MLTFLDLGYIHVGFMNGVSRDTVVILEYGNRWHY